MDEIQLVVAEKRRFKVMGGGEIQKNVV